MTESGEPPSSFAEADPALPAIAGIAWRPATLDDIDELAELTRDADRVDHPTYLTTREELADDFENSKVDLAVDCRVVVDADGAAIAFGYVLPAAVAETAERVYLFGAVRPEWRGRGIGRAVLAWQQWRGRQRLAASDPALPHELVTYCDESATATQRLLTRAGFPIVRYYLTLTRDLAEPVLEVPLPPAYRVETPRRDDLDELLAARNDAFRDHWGSQSSTVETFGRFLARSTTRLHLSVVARDVAAAIAGFVLTSVNPDDGEGQGYSSAYVDLVGVPRAFRGRRIAPALLTHVLGLCLREGLDRVVLDVDSESLTGALGLYLGVGFTSGERSMNFTKTV